MEVEGVIQHSVLQFAQSSRTPTNPEFNVEQISIENMTDFDVRQLDPMQNILLTDGEVLSAGMVRHIWWLRRDDYRTRYIAQHFFAFWHREITEDTVREVLRNEFLVTDRQTHGYTYVTEASIIIPTGIYWYIVAHYNEFTDIIQGDLFGLFGFRMGYEHIQATVRQWENSLPVDQNGVPIYPLDQFIIPEHPGRHLATLGVRPRADRSEFDIPPPLYSPPFQAGNGGFHHPREVVARGGQLFPFFSAGMEPSPPDFEEGAQPPAFSIAAVDSLFPQIIQRGGRRRSSPTINVERVTYQRSNSLVVFSPTMVAAPPQPLTVSGQITGPDDHTQVVSTVGPEAAVQDPANSSSESVGSLSSLELPSPILPIHAPQRTGPLDHEGINQMLDDLDTQFDPMGNNIPGQDSPSSPSSQISESSVDRHSAGSEETDILAYQDDENTHDFLAPIAVAYTLAPVPEARRKRYPDGSVPDPNDSDSDHHSEGGNQDNPNDGDNGHNGSSNDSSHDGDNDRNGDHSDSDVESIAGVSSSGWSTRSLPHDEDALIEWFWLQNPSDSSDSDFEGDIPYRAPGDNNEARDLDNAGST